MGDRYIQLTPVYEEGDELAEGEILGVDRTSVPLELDDIYASLDRLNVALGPEGANKNGALNDLLRSPPRTSVARAPPFNQTIGDFSRLSSRPSTTTRTSCSARSPRSQAFVSTLAENDTTVRQFNRSLADVSELLAGERQELAAVAGQPVHGPRRGQRLRQDQPRRAGPRHQGAQPGREGAGQAAREPRRGPRRGAAGAEQPHLTYNPEAGTLDTNANVGNLVNQIETEPALFLCTVVNSVDPSGGLCDLVQDTLPRPGALDALRGVEGGAARGADPFDPTLGGLVEVTR